MIIIQQLQNCINIIDSKQTNGKRIVFSASTFSISKSRRNGDKMEIISTDGNLLYEFDFSGVRVQDYLGTVTLWGGTVDELLNKLNNEYFVNKVSANVIVPLPTGAATSANQDTINGYSIKKNVGKVLDLTTSSGDPIAYPFTLDSIEINGTAITPTPAISQQITNSKDLVGVLAIIQDLYLFSVIDANNLLLNSGSLPLSEIVQIKIFANSGAQLFTYSTFIDSVDYELSSSQQILERLKALQADVIKNKNEILEKQDDQTALLEEIAANTANEGFTSFSVDSNLYAHNIVNQNVESFLCAFQVKAGQGSVIIKNFQVSIDCISNDAFLCRVATSKTLSTPLIPANFKDVGNGSKLQVARPSVNGVITTPITTIGGKDIRSYPAKQGTIINVISENPITLVEGVIYYILLLGRSAGLTVYDTENWDEK